METIKRRCATARLSDVLAVPRGVTAVIGGGGKTTLIGRLSRELCDGAHVLMTTTTRIRPPEGPILLAPTRAQIEAAWHVTSALTVGDPAAEGKLARCETLGKDWSPLADYVLVEADGSRGLPLKAPADYEPVLPENAKLTIAVAGMGCTGMTIAEAAHRSQRYAALAGLPMDAPVMPDTVARVLSHPAGQRKDICGRFAVVLNQADTPERVAFARAVAALLPWDTVIVALQTRPEWLEFWRGGERL